MLKPESLRQHLVGAVPEFARDPDKLKLHITDGRIVATGAGRSLSFLYRCTVRLLVLDLATHPDAVFVPLLAWLQREQPELLDNPELRERAIRFEAEVLDSEALDLQIELDLTERVRVAPRPGAPALATTGQRWDVEHLPEPAPCTGPCPDGVQLYLRDELVAEWPAPGA